MGFNSLIASFLASFILVLQRILLLIINPYKTMRTISNDEDVIQIVIIFGYICSYFYFANGLRPYEYEPFILFIMTVFNYGISVLFFYGISIIFHKEHILLLKPFALTLAYTLIPTIIWFSVSSLLFAILPPPRTLSMMGKAFSIFYISFSVAVLIWKVILSYLAIRFSSKMPFYRIVYLLLIYVAAAIPYSMALYAMKFFRIPFI